ncbi:Rix1 complex component [Boletus coccyginus]|nr:Rix1 complex component [Boletus coccyginus]
MPKSSRKKKEKVADFSKAKLKLGKGKKVPSNVIDTSFKARSIALPTQNIAVEKDDTVPTNKRRQTFNDILSLLKHYSAGTRKDAIFSARELLQDHPGLLERSVAPLLSACVRLIGDEDASVRKTLLSFFDWILPRLEKKDLIPHVPSLLLFTVSAQTHIFPEIRVDAVRFLDLLLDAVPESVVCGWNESGLGHGKRVLESYLGILSARTGSGGAEGTIQATSTTSVVLSPQSKLVVLQSLSSFLSHAIDPPPFASGGSHRNVGPATVSIPTWFLRPSFVTTRLYEEHANVFQPSSQGLNGKHLTWNMNPEFESFDEDFAYDPRFLCGESETAWDLNILLDLSPEMDDVSRPSGDIPLIVRLSRTLYSTLTATFLDGAPVVFSPSTNPTETEVQMLMAAFKITRTLYSAILQSADLVHLLAPCEELKTLLDYLAGYFPFSPAHREAKASAWNSSAMQVEQSFQDLSVIYCELTSLLVLVSHQSGTRNIIHRGNRLRAPRHKPLSPLKSRFSQADLVESYVIRLLQGDGGSGAQLPRPISAVVYTALLPTIWALLNQRSGQQPEKEPSSVLVAVLGHAMRTTPGSAVKRLTVEFVGRLLLLEKEAGYAGYFDPRGAGAKHKFQEWIMHLPKTLWEVGTDNPATTQTIFGVLLRLLQRGSHVIEREQITLLRSRLVPFFMIVHPIRGQVLGPFARIPSSALHVRYLALGLCASLVTDQTRFETVDDGLCNAVSEAVKGTREELYWDRVTEAMRSTV